VFALTPDGTDRVVWDVRAGVPLWQTDAPVTGITPFDGDLVALAWDGDRLQQLTLDLQGALLDTTELDPVDGTNPVPMAAGGELWVVDRAGGEAALYRVDGSSLRPVGPRAGTILGPVGADGRVWVAVDGALHEVVDDTLVPSGDDGLTCLTAIGGEAWACAERGLRSVDGGGLGTPLLEPAEVEVPDWALVSEEVLAACYSEWRVWANDTGVDPGPYPGDDEPPATTDPETPSTPTMPAETGGPPPPELEPAGCGCATGSPPAALLWTPLLLAAARRRTHFPARGSR
jgi:MYXO-CTERM domain-containing protein